MNFTQEQIDAGAEALRQHEQGGKRLNSWSLLPNSIKRKWRDKAITVLNAVSKVTV
jgi:hypothetical protein